MQGQIVGEDAEAVGAGDEVGLAIDLDHDAHPAAAV